MQTPWRALVINGTFLEVLEEHRARMENAGLAIVPIGGAEKRVTAAQVHELGKDVDVVFGPGPGLDAGFFVSAARLKVVAIAASGYESVDLEAATRAGVVVTNAPTPAGSEAVADVAFGLILAVAREIPQRHCLLVTSRRVDRSMGRGVWGKTLGIVGLGSIGKATARRAIGFNMRILASNRSWETEHQAFAEQYHVERVDLDRLLRESDFVSLHLRTAPAMSNLIGARELGLMKPTAYLINTARASLVDEQALYDALVNGRLAGAGLDTIVDKGLDTPLIGLPNVVGTPHLGNRCLDSVHDVMYAAVDDALAVLRGGQPRYPVNHPLYKEADTVHTQGENS